jgi:hypothetical protein
MKALSMVVKKKEKDNTPNFHPFHSRLRIIKNNKNGVMLWLKAGSGPNQFTPHATSPAKIARSIEKSDRRLLNWYWSSAAFRCSPRRASWLLQGHSRGRMRDWSGVR